MAIPLSSYLSKASGSIPFLLKDVDLKGGFRVVADIAERDTIHIGAKTAGMLVYVAATGEFYQWISSAWQLWDVTSMVNAGTGLSKDGEGALQIDTAHLDTLYAAAGHNHDAAYAPISHTHAISEVTNLQNELDGKAAASHTHAISEVTDLQNQLDGKASTSHNHTVASLSDVNLNSISEGELLGWDATNSEWVNRTLSEAGVAPASHNHDGTYAPVSHSHAISDVTNLQNELDGKAAATHNHDADYAPISHTHAISDVTNLQNTLDGKAAASHNHDWTEIQNVPQVTAMPGVTVSTTDPASNDGVDGDIWFVIPA